jgi:hypothetical protein
MVAFTSGAVLTAAALNTAFNSLTVNTQTGTSYTLVLADQGGLVTLSNASAVTVTIPTNASVAYATGTVINLLNLGAGSVTVSAAGGVTLNGSATTLAQNAQVTLIKLGTNTWNAVAGGGLPKATVSSTTGSPTLVTQGGLARYKWTGDGTVVIGTAGVCTALLIGGGGAGGDTYGPNHLYGGGGGGAGAFLSCTLYFPAAGAYNIKIGAGGAGAVTGYCGLPSFVQGTAAVAPGGGGGAGEYAQFGSVGQNGASGGGGAGSGGTGTGGVYGYNGGSGATNGSANGSGGGGGAL